MILKRKREQISARARLLPLILAGLVLSVGLASGCSASESGGADGSFVWDDLGNLPGTGGRSSGGDDGLTGDGQGGAPPLPEEQEDESAFRAPVATGSFLWSANPESGRVALLDARDASVRLLSAGLRPTEVFGLPSPSGKPRAIVQNQGSSDASILTFDGESISEQRIVTPEFTNRWAVSDDGKWAVAFGVEEKNGSFDPTQGLQEIAVVDLEDFERPPVRLTVGYRPRSVVLREERAVVVCEDGIALVSLGDTVELEDWLELGPGAGLDTSVTADGLRALVRHPGESSFEVFDLESLGEPRRVVMGGSVTDVDLTDSGRVVAVARDAGEVVTFLLDELDETDAAIARTTIDDAVIGSAAVAKNGDRAVLYTTAARDKQVTAIDLRPGADFLKSRKVSIQHAITGVVLSDDGASAIVYGPGAESGKGAFSVVTLDRERFARVVGTNAPIQAVSVASFGFLVAAHSSAVSEAHVGRLPELGVDRFVLGSRPLSIGILEAEGVGYVAQAHPEGRITFIGIRSGEVRSVSGYELSAEVVE